MGETNIYIVVGGEEQIPGVVRLVGVMWGMSGEVVKLLHVPVAHASELVWEVLPGLVVNIEIAQKIFFGRWIME